MLNNSFNFENLIATGKVITTPANTDLLTVNVRDPRYGGGYQPVAIQFDDFAAAIGGGGVSLTTVGTGGAATLVSGVLNIPTYQNQLVSGVNISTINGNNLTVGGNISVQPTLVSGSGNIVAGAPAWLESNSTDLTIWNNGKNNVATNTSYGEQALSSITTGPLNSAFGRESLRNVTSGQGNTGSGAYTLAANTTGVFNTAVGSIALQSNTTGSGNTAVGQQSLSSNTIGSGNVAVGADSLQLLTTGNENVAVGNQALNQTISGNNNTAIGVQALRANNNGNNTGIGYRALYNSQSDNNVAIGSNAAGALTTASGIGQNTAIGTSSLGNSDIGFRNVSVGFTAHRMGLNPRESVAIGFEALYNFTDFYSVAVGRGALRSNTTGAANVGVGANAGLNITTGDSNVALGSGALSGTTTGSSNIAIGSAANGLNTTGTASIVIGLSAQAQNYSHSIVLGREATATASNQFVVGSTTYNAGTVTNAAASQTHYWTVRINGTDYKILLST
jgi:hypothetical protein